MRKLCVLIVATWFAGHTSISTAQVGDDPVQLNGAARLVGTGRYRPGEWGLVSIPLRNGSDQNETAQSVSYFEEDRATQFGCRALVPARSTRLVSHPVYLPEDVDGSVSRLTLLTTLVEESTSGEVIRRQRDGELFPFRIIPFTGTAPETVFLSHNDLPDKHVYEAVVAVRTDSGLDRRVGMLTDFPLPTNPLAYTGTEQLILVDDSLAGDVAAASTIRQWVLDGGHLWVFLDLVKQQTLEQLLGSQCRTQYVDRLSLSEVTIVPTSRMRPPAEVREFEDPVPMVRVLVDDLEVTHTVNGWPAAFHQQVGRGRILFTTLQARGWIRPRDPDIPQPRDGTRRSDFVPSVSLQEATDAFMQSAPRLPLSAEQFKPYLYDRIGYRIVERGPVIFVLVLFCLGLLAVGAWLSRRGHLERILWIVPAGSVVAAGVLGVMGVQARQGMHDSVSVLQFVNLDAEQDDVVIEGTAALYQQDKGDISLGGTSDEFLEPERFDRDVSLRRLVWTGGDRWSWQSLLLEAGLRFAPFRVGTAIKPPARLIGSFGPDGFAGTLDSGSFQNLSDVLIASRTQHTMSLDVQDDGRVRGGRENVQEPGHYVSAALLTDEQRRRQDVMRQLLSASLQQEKYPHQPTLIAWAAPLETGLEFADHVDVVGSAILTIPIQWERPEPGSSVVIPAPFLQYDSVSNSTIGVTTAFDRHSGLWRDMGSAKSALLRFQIPNVVRPLEMEAATLTLDISAPSRIVKMSIGTSEELVSVAQWDGPLGNLTLKVDDPQALRLDDAGGLHVSIDVSPITFKQGEDALLTNEQESWQIHSLQLELTGRTQAGDPGNEAENGKP